MRKLLFIANFADKNEYDNKITSFSRAAYDAANELGFEFHINTNKKDLTPDDSFKNVQYHYVPIYRNPLSIDVIKAYRELYRVCKKNRFDVIHCNTPIGGLLGRLVGKRCGVKKVIYQVHGFHFYKGAPKKNWLIYYSIEKWLAHYTDAIITINREDYELATSKMHLHKGGKVYYVPGVGIDTTQYNISAKMRKEKRTELGLNEDDIALISMGDLIERKNYATSLRAIAKANNPNLQYFICGKGPEEENLKALSQQLGIAAQIHFLGFRSDIKELLAASDIFLFTTKQDGLSRSMMEAMASGLACIASKIRGNIDLIDGTNGGFLCETTDADAFADKINLLANDSAMRETMGRNNLIMIQKFSTGNVTSEVRKIYEVEFGGGITLDEYILTLIEFCPLWAKKRMELGIPLDAFVLIAAGELNTNKNNCIIISAMEQVKRKDIHYVLCGIGDQEEYLRNQADAAGLRDNVHFLGFRNDLKELYEMADCFVMPSFREGLSRSLMEAMACGLPCVVSRIRGNVDLIKEGEGGYLCMPEDKEDFREAIKKIYNDREAMNQMAAHNLMVIQKYDVKIIEEYIKQIYYEVFQG